MLPFFSFLIAFSAFAGGFWGFSQTRRAQEEAALDLTQTVPNAAPADGAVPNAPANAPANSPVNAPANAPANAPTNVVVPPPSDPNATPVNVQPNPGRPGQSGVGSADPNAVAPVDPGAAQAQPAPSPSPAPVQSPTPAPDAVPALW